VSRNLGLREARAEYLTFLDGDDVFRREKVERQSAILSEHPFVAMVYGPTLYWRDWPGAPSGTARNSMGTLGVNPDRVYAPPELMKLYLQDGGAVPCICGLTVRRSVALEIGGFDERIHHMYEDQVFLAKVCLRYPVFVESGCWDQYRQHPQSTSHQAIASGTYHPSRPNASQEAFLTWLEEHLRLMGTQDVELAALLKQVLWPYRHPVAYRLQERGRAIKRRLLRHFRRRHRVS
jgi:hypothetical protein